MYNDSIITQTRFCTLLWYQLPIANQDVLYLTILYLILQLPTLLKALHGVVSMITHWFTTLRVGQRLVESAVYSTI